MSTELFSDYLVFVDESGDHGLKSIDPEYPVFALVFCVIKKEDYLNKIVPAIQQLKLDFWGHDQIILHENEIRRKKGAFSLLMTNPDLREDFFYRLRTTIGQAEFRYIASVIKKEELIKRYTNPFNPYEIAMLFCMEKLLDMMSLNAQSGKAVHVICESRGKNEDRDLELEFRRICDNEKKWGYKSRDFSDINFQLICADKKSNSAGLQLVDLIARPIALRALRPQQKNLAYDVIDLKEVAFKCFP